jgi:hypothetical protein
MANKMMTKAEADRRAKRIMRVAAAAAHCLRKMGLVGKRLTAKQKSKLKVCMMSEVGRRRK